jgi:predicted peptidase
MRQSRQPVAWLLAGLLSVALSGCAGPHTSAAIGAHTPQVAEGRVTHSVGYEYLLYLPAGYTDVEEPWPLILFLHGAGERGTDVNDVKRIGIAKRIEDGDDFPFVIVSPHCPTDSWWEPDGLIVVLDDVLARYNVDPARVYVTGLSMGGTGTWMLAAEYPDRFAAIAPVCGRSLPLRSAPLTDMPVWAFHGDADHVVDVWNSTNQIERLKRQGNTRARLTIYPGLRHSIWQQTYANPELYAWFLEHERSITSE